MARPSLPLAALAASFVLMLGAAPADAQQPPVSAPDGAPLSPIRASYYAQPRLDLYCNDDDQCAPTEECDEVCKPHMVDESSGKVAAGTVLLIVGGLGASIPTNVLVLTSLDFGGGGHTPVGRLAGAGVTLGVSVAAMITGACLIGAGARHVPEAGLERAATVELTPVVSPELTGLVGRF